VGFYRTAPSRPAAAKAKPDPTYCVKAAGAPPVLEVLTAPADVDEADALVDVPVVDVVLTVLLVVLLAHPATEGSVIW